jgi:hypothetical protein
MNPYFIHTGARIPDPTTRPKEEGEQKISFAFYVASNFPKFKLLQF